MTNKKVGIVIPIYNVEKYLEECLESVINQSYKNLEIILVNDGSTDENSFKIAKEYALKDNRITLFDKENGGLSSARNIGIEYLSGDYKLEFEKEEQDFFVFKITNENPLKIHNIYKSKAYFEDKEKELEIPKVDYLIFLDSDNSWELDCIEECVKRMQDIDVLWFDSAHIYEDGIKDKGQRTRMDYFLYTKECVITPKDYAQRALKIGSKDISFWNGLIDFNFLKKIKLKFINQIINEDIYFGMLLFAQASNIYIFPKKFYICRLRANSISNHDKKITKENIAPYFKNLYESFNQDAAKAKKYLKAASRVITALALVDFFEKVEENENNKAIKEVFLPFYVRKALMIKKFSNDPLNLKPKLNELKPHIKFALPYDIWKTWQKIKNRFKFNQI